MWKSVAEMLSKFATLMCRVKRQEQASKDGQQEVKPLSSALERVIFEAQRDFERERHEREKETEKERYEREQFRLCIENELLKVGRQLRPKTEDPDAQTHGFPPHFLPTSARPTLSLAAKE